MVWGLIIIIIIIIIKSFLRFSTSCSYSSVCRTKKKEKGEANADIVSTVSIQSKWTDFLFRG